METYKRVFVIVLDSLGIGAMPDSEKFGDKGVDTFGHILDKMGTLDIPNLQKLGMLNLHKGGTMEGVENPIGRYMRIGEMPQDLPPTMPVPTMRRRTSK